MPSTITYFKTKLERKNEVLQMKKHWCYVVAVVPTEVFQNLASNSEATPFKDTDYYH